MMPTVGWDVELQERWLKFEMRKFEAEDARQREILEREAAGSREEMEVAKLRGGARRSLRYMRVSS
jgi:hypothetical protein